MYSTLAEEVQIVNDSITSLSQWGDQWGLKTADLLNKS